MSIFEHSAPVLAAFAALQAAPAALADGNHHWKPWHCDSGAVQNFWEDVIIGACPETPEAVFWYTGAGMPIAYGGDDGLWRISASSGNAVSWQEMTPHVVQIDGDVALLYYSVTWLVTAPNGDVRRNPSRRFTVLRKLDGRWAMAGGTVVPTP